MFHWKVALPKFPLSSRKLAMEKSDLDFQIIATHFETYGRNICQAEKGGEKNSSCLFLAPVYKHTNDENHQQSSSKLIQVILLFVVLRRCCLILLQSCLFCVLFSSSLNLPRTVEQEILTLEEKLKASRAFNTKRAWIVAPWKNDETSKWKIFDSSQANVRSECRKLCCGCTYHVSKMSKNMFMLLLIEVKYDATYILIINQIFMIFCLILGIQI